VFVVSFVFVPVISWIVYVMQMRHDPRNHTNEHQIGARSGSFEVMLHIKL